ncbi:hypothetical protein BAUCODRAFT_569787 [Baudoinia panamericana UAMH 10762]|uniref:Uncharacterized protein n=1 Tax=Baudoinia panamericana (strain UAMH 10762) TaxID=717646 RepID=M2MLW5_BAUPA|nr:uncharacterized protein BAUCODRAFT_569787 [Baudoinia panamericana UAMH 10762]EMC92383.1 hypothetical protein BAUCODRAFT_569787 [Baudoinia panamericana UAMH 10762]
MSTPKAPGYFKQLWYGWKSLKLPWRRQFLVGADLAGNTFWEFKDALNSNRFRRIVKYARAPHYADVKITAQWHQWLRHTRADAPTIQEQQYDVSRQAMMKQLAAKADERWKSVPSFLDSPARQQPQPATQPKDPGGYAPQTEPEQHQGVTSGVEDPIKVQQVAQEGKDGKEVDEGRFKGRTREKPRVAEENPWQRQQRGAPSENWQPQAWTPGAAQRR